MISEKNTEKLVYLYLPSHSITEEPWKTYLEAVVNSSKGVIQSERGMKSEIATLQALGRALRKHDTKEKVYVYDFFDQEKYLLDHSKERKKHYKAEGHEVLLV